MMKRITAMLIMVLLLPAVLLGATGDAGSTEGSRSSTAELEIKAYKVGADDFNQITITDAIPGSLKEIDNDGSIDITSRLEYLFGATGEKLDSTLFGDRIIFSYRVVGNTADNFEMNITFGEFTHNGQSSNLTASFMLGNTNYVFSNTGNSVSGAYTITQDKNGNEEQNMGPFSLGSTASVKWTVSGSGTTPEWIVRGAVALTIDETSYDNASYGEHTSTVTVGYVVN